MAAVEDARKDTDRVAQSVRSLFGEAASSRRAAVRTSLASAAREALRSWREATPGAPEPRLVETEAVSVGIAPAECARWLFRLLTVLGRGNSPAVRVEIDRGDEGPRLAVDVDQPLPADAAAALEPLAREVAKAGGRLEARGTARSAAVRFLFPRALGEACPSVLEGAR